MLISGQLFSLPKGWVSVPSISNLHFSLSFLSLLIVHYLFVMAEGVIQKKLSFLIMMTKYLWYKDFFFCTINTDCVQKCYYVIISKFVFFFVHCHYSCVLMLFKGYKIGDFCWHFVNFWGKKCFSFAFMLLFCDILQDVDAKHGLC